MAHHGLLSNILVTLIITWYLFVSCRFPAFTLIRSLCFGIGCPSCTSLPFRLFDTSENEMELVRGLFGLCCTSLSDNTMFWFLLRGCQEEICTLRQTSQKTKYFIFAASPVNTQVWIKGHPRSSDLRHKSGALKWTHLTASC